MQILGPALILAPVLLSTPLRSSQYGDGKDDIVTFTQVPVDDFDGHLIGQAPVWVSLSEGDHFGPLSISDAIALLGFLFLGTAPPPAPGPNSNPCGADPDPASSDRDLGCAAYGACGG